MSLQPCSALLGPHVREISLIQRCAWLLSPPEGQAHEVVGFFCCWWWWWLFPRWRGFGENV